MGVVTPVPLVIFTENHYYHYYVLVKFSCFPSIVAGSKLGEEFTSAAVLSLVCGLFQAL